ncbi:uncharacterized protein LOC117948122 [Etheostoma cragini]|uniref:uncharacterized protein LOC117948122 n=1 Tax=Etheostoma cragini TaxID=417921 RepID=UPI00155F43E4|nr:uncharacterized protein LOC117948122 [Etheostoma cragini]
MFGKSNLRRPSNRTCYVGDEDPLIKDISTAMARLSLSGQTELESRSSNSRISNNEALEKNSTPKRRWEDLESGGFRRPDSLGPETKRKRVDTTAINKSSWVSIGCTIAFQRKYVSAFQYRAIEEEVKQTLPREAQKKMATPKMSLSPTQYLKDKDKLSYKRKREDLDSAGIRRQHNLAPQKKRRRVVRRRVQADADIVMVAMPKKKNRRRNRRSHVKPVQSAKEWRHPECSGQKGPGEKTWRGGGIYICGIISRYTGHALMKRETLDHNTPAAQFTLPGFFAKMSNMDHQAEETQKTCVTRAAVSGKHLVRCAGPGAMVGPKRSLGQKSPGHEENTRTCV